MGCHGWSPPSRSGDERVSSSFARSCREAGTRGWARVPAPHRSNGPSPHGKLTGLGAGRRRRDRRAPRAVRTHFFFECLGASLLLEALAASFFLEALAASFLLEALGAARLEGTLDFGATEGFPASFEF